MDEAGSTDIYTIDLLEAMLMADEAWEAVDQVMIKHCWEHTRIQPLASNIPPLMVLGPAGPSQAVLTDKKAWGILQEFAVMSMVSGWLGKKAIGHLEDSK
jgi:hypothetical protein